MTIKKIISFLALLLSIVSMPAFAGTIDRKPIYSEPRFAPTDTFHATCLQSAQVSFEGKEKNVSKIHLELQYLPNELEISRIVGLDQIIANYRIEYDRVIFDIDNPKIVGKTALFQLNFKSKKDITKTKLLIATGSYFVSDSKITYIQKTIPLTFASVPECDPDRISPNISMILPSNTGDRIPLDQYFIFDIQDDNKWIDKDAITVTLNDRVYTIDTEYLKRKDNHLILYPKDRLPTNQKISIKVQTQDLQSYGGPNTSQKSFSFKTSTGLTLLDDISPMRLRILAKGANKLQVSGEECSLLRETYHLSRTLSQTGISSILEKIGCEAPLTQDTTSPDESQESAEKDKYSMTYISVFAALGWILFGITLILKFHYIASYKKHKKNGEYVQK